MFSYEDMLRPYLFEGEQTVPFIVRVQSYDNDGG